MQLITRAEWGARYQNGATNDDGTPVILPMRWQDNWLHHSVTAWLPPDATLAQEIAAVRELERIGQGEFGQGISYTRIIPASGRVFEGHGLDRRGAHTYRRNDSSRAICLIGNYETNTPTREQLRSAAAVVREWHAADYCPQPALSGGHRDVYATACPGRNAYAAIPEINRLAESGEPLDPEDDMPSIQEVEDAAYRATLNAINDARHRANDRATAARDSLGAIVWEHHIANPGGGSDGSDKPAGVILGWSDAREGHGIQAIVSALSDALTAAQGGDITEDKLREIVERAVEQHIQITGSVEITARPAPMQEVPNS